MRKLMVEATFKVEGRGPVKCTYLSQTPNRNNYFKAVKVTWRKLHGQERQVHLKGINFIVPNGQYTSCNH
jgi:hypothetical protein